MLKSHEHMSYKMGNDNTYKHNNNDKSIGTCIIGHDISINY